MYLTIRGEVLFIQLFQRAGVPAGRYALERIVAEPAAAMLGRNDAALLTDHRMIVHPSGKLTIGTITIDFLAEEQRGHRLSRIARRGRAFCFQCPLLYTLLR